MAANEPGDLWKKLASEIAARDFLGAKASVEMLRDLGGIEMRSALEALLESSAFDILKSSTDAIRARWLAIQIIAAAGNKQKAAAHRLALELRQHLVQSGVLIEEELAGRTLKSLRDIRAFEALARLGDRLLSLGLKDPTISKFVAQALIDTGYSRAGLAVLETMLSSTPQDHPERLDGLALAGRAHKQVYADARGGTGGLAGGLREAIVKSAACYEDSYLAMRSRLSPQFAEWSYPAVNLIAVVARAKNDGISVPLRVNPDDLARQIILEFNKVPAERRQAWDYASAAEASIALDDWTAVEVLLHQYASDRSVNAFQLAGTVRQLEEVWRVDATKEIPGRVMYFLKAQLLAKDGGEVLLTPEARVQLMNAHARGDGAQLEVIMSDGRPKPLNWLKLGLERANSVGLIQYRSNKEGFGTGFLVRGGDFIAHLGDEPVLLTNAHVISERPSELNDPNVPSVLPRDAMVEFTAVGSDVRRRVFEVNRILWDSPRSELDACLVALNPVPDIPCCVLSSRRPEVGKSRVIVIGHPGGEREMKLSLFESPVMAFEPRGLLSTGTDQSRMFLRYTNPTIPGNSGSPVFDIDDWGVVGLHHAGSKAQTTGADGAASGSPFGNEGVFIQSIAEASRRGERSLVPAGSPVKAAIGAPQSVAAPEANATTPSKRPAGGKLVHDVPSQMFERRALLVTANISRVESEKLFQGLSRPASQVHDVVPTAAMSVCLRSEDGAFEIVPKTAEKMWIDRRGSDIDSVTKWQWMVRPVKSGSHTLTLVLQGQEAQDGIEAALPPIEQTIAVRVRVDTSARAMTVTKWAAVAAAGGMLSFVGQKIAYFLNNF